MAVSRERAEWLGREVFPHENALRGWLARRPLLEAMDVDDVVQETYAILAGLPSVDHVRNPRAYMFETAKSLVLKGLRRARVVTIDAIAEVETLHLPADDITPERIASDRQELSRIARLIGELPPRCRDVFTLRRIRGLGQRETARALGMAESTVEKHMAKALRILADAISRGGNRTADASREGDFASSALTRRSTRKRRRD